MVITTDVCYLKNDNPLTITNYAFSYATVEEGYKTACPLWKLAQSQKGAFT